MVPAIVPLPKASGGVGRDGPGSEALVRRDEQPVPPPDDNGSTVSLPGSPDQSPTPSLPPSLRPAALAEVVSWCAAVTGLLPAVTSLLPAGVTSRCDRLHGAVPDMWLPAVARNRHRSAAELNG